MFCLWEMGCKVEHDWSPPMLLRFFRILSREGEVRPRQFQLSYTSIIPSSARSGSEEHIRLWQVLYGWKSFISTKTQNQDGQVRTEHLLFIYGGSVFHFRTALALRSIWAWGKEHVTEKKQNNQCNLDYICLDSTNQHSWIIHVRLLPSHQQAVWLTSQDDEHLQNN